MKELIPEFCYTKKNFVLDWFSGSGPGGQRRNKVQCCLRLTHIDSGITVQSTKYAFRNQNLKSALQQIKPLLEKWINSQLNNKTFPKNYSVIRTYNIVENRVTDNTLDTQYTWDEINKDLSTLVFDRKIALIANL